MAASTRVDANHAGQRSRADLFDRVPPHSLEAERCLLGSLFLDPLLCDDVILILSPEDFYSDAHRRLFTHLLALHDEGGRIDAMLLTERLRAAGDLEAVGGMAYLAEVAQSVPVPAHAVYYAEIVRAKGTLRNLIHTSTEILREAWDETRNPKELLDRAEEQVFAIRDRQDSGQIASMHDVLLEAFRHIDARLEHGGATGLSTGFKDLDELTGGLHPAELVILAARPSMGKTALATNIADHITVAERRPVLFVSLEMAQLELAQRMLCGRGKIDGSKFRSGFLSSEDRNGLVRAASELSGAPLFVDDTPSRSVAEIAAAARRLKRKQDGLGLIVIDYLQLIEPDNARDPRQEQVARIARRLKGLARELSAPVLCLAQLNRQAEVTRDNRPRLSHLRESGAIEQDADVVMFVHREEYYHTREEAKERDICGKAELIVAKQRNGPTGEVPLAWRQEWTRFENRALREYEEFDSFASEDVF